VNILHLSVYSKIKEFRMHELKLLYIVSYFYYILVAELFCFINVFAFPYC